MQRRRSIRGIATLIICKSGVPIWEVVGDFFCSIVEQGRTRFLRPSSWSGESHHEHRPLCKRKLRSYITGRRIVVPLVGSAIVLWGFCLSSGCAGYRYLLAPIDHRGSRTRIGTVSYLGGMSNTFWGGCTDCPREIQLGLATP